MDMGTTQMMSVPYALYAGNNLPAGTAVGDILYWNGSTWSKLSGGARGKLLTYCDSVPQWGPCLPIVATDSVTTHLGYSHATVSFRIVNSGGEVITSGVCWSTSPGPTISSNVVSGGGQIEGNYVLSIAELDTNTTYYVRSFATNSAGTAYGNEITFTSTTHVIGMNFYGGIIAYILQPGDAGYSSASPHGIIVSSEDQSDGIVWCSDSTYTGIVGTNTALGAGATNTAMIVAAFGAGTAAYLCDTLTLNGYTDWYLPSKSEALKICTYLSGFYWTSSENLPIGNPWQFFSPACNFAPSGYPGTNKVRAIRSF